MFYYLFICFSLRFCMKTFVLDIRWKTRVASGRTLTNQPRDFGTKVQNKQTEKFLIARQTGETIMTDSPVLLNKHEVERCLSYEDLIPRLESVMGKFSKRDSSEIIQPVRSVVPIQQHNGYEWIHVSKYCYRLLTYLYKSKHFCQVFRRDACISGRWGYFMHKDGDFLPTSRGLQFTINSSHSVTVRSRAWECHSGETHKPHSF